MQADLAAIAARIPRYPYAYFNDSRHVEIRRPLWTVTTPVSETSSYRVVEYARNDALP